MGGAEVYLVTNWTSRSKKTYEIIADREKFRALSGRIITARCDISEEKSWAGKIVVREFQPAE